MRNILEQCNLGVSDTTVEILMATYPQQGHMLQADNLNLTPPPTFDWLCEQQIHMAQSEK
jgi:hypothetical protein